ncbi:hypothetical protein F4553_001859 [Allocatelliglobosispora scoriae]|uniref:Ig-like domain-containing protein n=1 Tax=Allocatelliglobosispora scoriae TaxID=643052 RepID=A0A841BNU8_9ACTN|nr:hypothetical protein [Allocatelliglobosispora scoriae]MBB5868480.1 hypothetical protein [Allocatelliglobosispora scoriae]
MRIRILAVATAAALGVSTLLAGPAAAQGNAPDCISGQWSYVCDADSTGPTTWTVAEVGKPVQTFVSGSAIGGSCRYMLKISYSYVEWDGSTVNSAVATVYCRSGMWPAPTER